MADLLLNDVITTGFVFILGDTVQSCLPLLGHTPDLRGLEQDVILQERNAVAVEGWSCDKDMRTSFWRHLTGVADVGVG